MRLNSNQCRIAHVGIKNYSTDVVDFIVSSQEEKRGFNVNNSIKTDVHCVAGVGELHFYMDNKMVPCSNALGAIEMCKGVVHLGFWRQ